MGCNNDLKKYYPYSDCYTSNGDKKSFFPGNHIYIDNFKINDFELYMVYNTLDTVTCGRSWQNDWENNKEKKIYIIDTLKFNVTKDGVESLNINSGIWFPEIKSPDCPLTIILSLGIILLFFK